MAEYILTDITRKEGKLNYSDIWEVTWVDLVDLQVYATVVDATYRNYTRSNWHNIVNGPIPYGLYSGLRKTAKKDKDGLPVISADSHPALIDPMTEAEVYRILEIRQSQLQP